MKELIDPLGFLASTPLVPFDIDPTDNRVLYVGPQAEGLLGYTREEWHAVGFWSNHVLPDDHVNLENARRNTREGRGHHEIDYRMETADGRVVWIVELASYVEMSDGPRIRGFLWDVSTRKRQEVALWKAEERVRALLRRAPDAMILTDRRGSIINMNDQAEALLGYSLSDVVGSRLEHLLPEPIKAGLAQLRAAFDRDPERRSVLSGQQFTFQRSDGTEIPVELSLSLVAGDEDKQQILWSARDLTVRRRAEARRRGKSLPDP